MDEDELYIITIDDTTEKVSLFADSGGVTSFKGRIGAVVPTAGDYTTDQVTEANNLYYTEARVTDNASVQANTAKVSSKFEDGTDPLDAVYMDGNVGIGTTSPTGLLEIVGGNGSQLQISAGNAVWDAEILLDTTDSNGRWSIKAEGTDESFRVVNVDQGSTVLTALYDGNFGIGTTTPSEKLEVNGKIKATNLSGTNTGDQGDEITTSRFEARCLGQAVNGRIDNYASALANIGLKDSSTASILFDAKVCGVGEGKLFNLLPFDIYKDFTVARNGTATYVANDGLIKTALANVPRIDWTDSANPALLSEPQATNLLLQSQTPDVANWSTTRASILPNTIISPDGTSTGSKLLGTTDNNSHVLSQLMNTPSSNDVVRFSQFFKKVDYDYVYLRLTDDAANVGGGVNKYEAVFDLVNGTVTATGSSIGTPIAPYTDIINYGNGWFRCVIGLTKYGGAVRTDVQAFLWNQSTWAVNPTLIGSTTEGTYIWGAQLETGTTATSYIPTVASTVTRIADVVTLKTDGLGLTSITETINGVDQAPTTTIPATYTVPVYNYGSELVTNGDFASDLSSWIDSSSDTFEQLSSWQGESGIMHIITSAANRGARQTGVYTIGIDYKFTAKLWIVSGGVYFGKNTDKIGGVDYTTIGEWIDISVDFNPNSDSTLRTYTVGSGEFYLNNISVKEALSAGVKINKIKMT